MGKNKIKDYILISGFNLNDSNRGTAALGYGSLSFLSEKGYINKEDSVLVTFAYGNPFKASNHIDRNEVVKQGKHEYNIQYKAIWKIEFLLLKLGIRLPFMKISKLMKRVKLVAAINGGDGFSDIYGTHRFTERLYDTTAAMSYNTKLIILPQTLGPFSLEDNRKVAEKIIRYASDVFVRDKCYVNELQKLAVNYSETKDLSYFMQPQKWDIDIAPNSIGINISGLAFDNNFGPLANQFSFYPLLIQKIVSYFQSLNRTIYIIPHSYDYKNPCIGNDDLLSSKKFYDDLNDKHNVILIDKDLISPKIKYVISKMDFFIGTRMHANFAAIYSNVPLFGLAYSYKFKGAFEAHGIYDRTEMINNIEESDIDRIVKEIGQIYLQTTK